MAATQVFCFFWSYFLQVQMVLSASVPIQATGIWPTTISTALWTVEHGVIVPNSPASAGTASRSSCCVTITMTVVMAVMSLQLSVVSRTFVRS